MSTILHPQLISTAPGNEFAHRTMTHRLPANIRNIIATNPDWPGSILTGLEQLAAEIGGDSPIPPLPGPAWDQEYWTRAWTEHRGETWHNTPWFFGETYGFRLVLAITRYFETRLDPYAPLKLRELESGSSFLPIQRFYGASSPGAVTTGSARPAEDLIGALHLCAWGNKADISFASGGPLDNSAGESDLLLLDHSEEVANLLLRKPADAPIHVIMDNSGAELAGDLVLALTLVRTTGTPVVLHPKFYPTYVSDTIVEDVHTFLDHALRQDDPVVAAFAGEIKTHFETGRISLAPDPFWCEAEFLAAMPPRISTTLNRGALVIVKGDFNYRRVFRDTIWDADADPAAATGLYGENGMAPVLNVPVLNEPVLNVPVLLLRTMKSDCLAGVAQPALDTLDRTEPGWRTQGQRGVIQLVKPYGQ